MVDRMVDGMVAIPEELIEDIYYHFSKFNTSKDKGHECHHFVELFNKVHDLSTWHSGFDSDTGTMPWERNEDLG